MKKDNTSKLLIVVTAIFLVSILMGCIEEPFAEMPENNQNTIEEPSIVNAQ